MHQQWDPVMLEEYLVADLISAGELADNQASRVRRSVLSRSVAVPRPSIDVRRPQPTVDLTFD